MPGAMAPLWGIVAAVMFIAFPTPLAAPPGLEVEAGRFPEREADYIEANLRTPRAMYNDVAHGGYLIWRVYPADRVFIDGRNEVHAALLAEIASALNDGREWSELLDRHGIQAALVRYREERISVLIGGVEADARSFAALHFPKKTWALVFWGDAGMVFLRRGGAHDSLIERDEYRHVHPEDWEHQMSMIRDGDAALKEGIRVDLRRRIEGGPPCARATRLLATIDEGSLR